jgi:acyl transferase domain-containing protein
MTATEVNGTDPQQFHLLEVSFEALENGERTIGRSNLVATV